MKKIPKQEYTPEFRELAVKRVKAGQTAGAVAKELGLIEQTCATGSRRSTRASKLNGPGTKQVTPEQMELSRVRAENIRLNRENEILKNRPSGKSRPGWIETGCRTLSLRVDSGRQLFGGMLTPSKNLAQGKLRTRLWWRTN